ncbi:MAG TPA: sugar phosphate isomerase/epimerase, partial [Candidatus Hydrogenedentes bacterium]|nr:sugar phosphate isomerase/epimerase [Candidatus Hydrogenedentota bacterium]
MMLTGINQWAFPDDMLTASAMAIAARLGFQSFEICVGESGPTSLAATESDITALRREADKLGLSLRTVGTGLGWQYPMTSPDVELRAKGADATVKALQIAKWLGAHTLLVVPGIVSPEISYEAALENALTATQELTPAAEKAGVTLGIENVWNKFLLSPVEMRDFIDQCESEYVGAYIDTGNIILY